MIEKEQKAKRVYHRTKPASKSKVRAIRFDLDLVEFINLQPNVSLFISCSSNTKTPFEEEAYKMLKTEISDTFSSVGNDVDILNTSTEYYTDSLCVIKLSVKGKNELGGKTSNVFEYIYLKEDDSSTMGFLREIQKNDSSLMKVADIESEDSKWNNKSFDEKLYHLCRVYAATKAYAKQLKKKYKLN